MKLRILQSLIYGGKTYGVGETVEIIEKDIIKSCKDRGLVEELSEEPADENKENLETMGENNENQGEKAPEITENPKKTKNKNSKK